MVPLKSIKKRTILTSHLATEPDVGASMSLDVRKHYKYFLNVPLYFCEYKCAGSALVEFYFTQLSCFIMRILSKGFVVYCGWLAATTLGRISYFEFDKCEICDLINFICTSLSHIFCTLIILVIYFATCVLFVSWVRFVIK